MSDNSLTFDKLKQMLDELGTEDRSFYDTLIANPKHISAAGKIQAIEDYTRTGGMNIIESNFVPDGKVIMTKRMTLSPIKLDNSEELKPVIEKLQKDTSSYLERAAMRLGYFGADGLVIERPSSIVVAACVDTSPVECTITTLKSIVEKYANLRYPNGKSKRGLFKWLNGIYSLTRKDKSTLRTAIRVYSKKKYEKRKKS